MVNATIRQYCCRAVSHGAARCGRAAGRRHATLHSAGAGRYRYTPTYQDELYPQLFLISDVNYFYFENDIRSIILDLNYAFIMNIYKFNKLRLVLFVYHGVLNILVVLFIWSAFFFYHNQFTEISIEHVNICIYKLGRKLICNII